MELDFTNFYNINLDSKREQKAIFKWGEGGEREYFQ
jgi:hypothetical protein